MPPELRRTVYESADVTWSCARKKAYTDEKFAQRVARQAQEKSGIDMVAYGCTHCGQFHIGRAHA